MAYVYRFKNDKDRIIYVGYTGRTLDARMAEHFTVGVGHLPKKCYQQTYKIEYLKFGSKSDAMVAECYYINKYKPIFNTQSKQLDNLSLEIPILSDWKTFKVLRNKLGDKTAHRASQALICNIGVWLLLVLYLIYVFINSL